MTDLTGTIAFLLLPLIGLVVWRLDFVRGLPLAARTGVALSVGALIVGIVMGLLTAAGIEWSRTVLFPILGLITAAGFVLARRSVGVPAPPTRTNRIALAGTGVCWLFVLYATLDARHSCGDLAFTWGPKAIRWFRAGGIDAALMKAYPQLTIDYPPLQTLLFAWSNTLSHEFSWWAAVLTSPLFFLATLVLFRTWSGDDLGTLLLATTLTYTFTTSQPAGCAEPLLLLYEVMAIAALTFLEDPRAQTFFAALGVAGAAWTKLEGSTFAVAIFLAILVVQRDAKRAFIAVAPASVLMAGWMAFVFHNDLLFMYGGARLPIYPAALPAVLKTLVKVARFDLLWLPWIIPIVLIAFGNWRRALLPLTVAALTAGAMVYFYLHYYDPVWWIESSSPRVLLTPLTALVIAAAAAWSAPRTAVADPGDLG
jgi:hypothetical protein